VFVCGDTIWGFQMALVGSATVLTVLLRDHGASATMIGGISAIDTVGVLLPQLAGLFIFRSVRTRKHDLLIWHFIGILPFLFVIALLTAFAGRLGDTVLRWGVLLCYAGHMCGIGVNMGVWTDWIAHLFPVRVRGRVIGVTWFFAALAGMGAAILAGRLLTLHPGTAIYALLYLAAGTIATVSILVFTLISDHAVRDQTPETRLRVRDMARHAFDSLRSVNFRAFILGRIIATAGFCIVPFITLYYLSPAGGGIAKGSVVAFAAAMSVGLAVGHLAAGVIGDHHGHRAGLLIAVAMQIVTLVILLSSRGPASCIAAYFACGCVMGMAAIAHSNILFETCPHESRVTHITAGNIIIGSAIAVMPLLAGKLAQMTSVRVLFVVSLALSVAAFVWFLVFVREPRTYLQGT